MVLTLGVLWVASPVGGWDPVWLAVALIALAPLAEASAARQDISPRVSLGDLTIIPAMVLLGPLAAAVTSLAATATDAARTPPHGGRLSQLSGVWIQLLWPVVGSLAFFAMVGGDPDPASAEFLAATAAAAALGVVLNLCLVIADVKVDPGAIPIQPRYAVHATALVSGPVVIASIAIVAAYAWGGVYAMTLVILALLVLRLLVGRLLLLLSRERQLELRHRELSTFHLGVLGLLTETLARRDRLTSRHSAAVSRWAGDLAEAAGCSAGDNWTIRTAGLLHDVGKFVLPDSLLHGGDLSERERHRLRAHPPDGAELVGRVAGLAEAAQLIRHHHERYDGSGYPDGLAGVDIPLGSRILAICEAYDAMTARDSYRAPVAPAEAIAELRAEAGFAFDPALVARFTQLLELGPVAYRHGEAADFQQELDSVLADERAVVIQPPSASANPGRGDLVESAS